MDRLDVGVVGCGTAGAAVALFLARAGHTVTIYERVPDPGPDLGGSWSSYVAHFVFYAALWTALSYGLRFERPLLAFVLTVAYGLSDELHQSFVEGRDADPVDLLVDGIGAAFAWWLSAAVVARRRAARRLQPPE